MRPLRFSINITLDGCYDHRVGIPDEELHQNAEEGIANADALILGRNTYQLMESAWRPPNSDAFPEWTQPFARTIDQAKKYVVSTTLDSVDWNAELIKGDLEQRIRELKQQPGRSLAVGGAKLAQSLAEMGLIDEYELVVHPRLVGHGPTLFEGLTKMVDLKLVDIKPFASGVVAMRYELKR